jgi:hypothetical protein
MWIALIVGVVLLLVAAGLIWSGRRTQRKVNILRQAVPTNAAEVANAFPGELVSVRGAARPQQRLVSEQAEVPSIYYRYSVVREYERTEQSTTGTGRNRRTQSRQVRSSETVASNDGWVPFSVEDESGSVPVLPDGAEFDARQVMNRYEPYTGQGGSISIGGLNINLGSDSRTLGHRFTEYVIAADEPVYVLGCVDENGRIGKPPAGRDSATFIISYRDDKSLREDWESSARWQAYAAIGAGAIGAILVIVGLVLAIV